jgi:glycosyltransferase involved in cell wall biosynthesis
MTEPVRVLHIIKTLDLGGAETNLLNLARAFDRTRVETHVAYSRGGEIEPRFRAAGVKLVKYAERAHRIKDPQTLAIVWRLVRYIRKNRIDIVQTHNFNAHVWGLLAARLGGARLVEHVHDFRYTPTDDLVRRHSFINQYGFIKYFKKWSDRIIVLTDAHRDHVIANGYAHPAQVIKIQNGIAIDDAPPEAADRARFDIPADAVVILTSARMDPSKNITLIVRIAAKVRERSPDALFLIAGSGTHLDAYRQLAADLGVTHCVRFLGFHDRMDDLLSVSDIFVLPSFLELHSIAILEATRMRVPIVVSEHVGCNDEFVEDGVSGFLCDPFSDDRWVEVIAALATDAALRKRIGLGGYETCRRLFDLPDTARRFEGLYAELVERP